DSASAFSKDGHTLTEIDYGQIEIRLLAGYLSSSIKDTAEAMTLQEHLLGLVGGRPSIYDTVKHLKDLYPDARHFYGTPSAVLPVYNGKVPIGDPLRTQTSPTGRFKSELPEFQRLPERGKRGG
ncbi:hypothetical protein, partial [Parvimonas sp. M13]|uniref:hypothetical protein n=1 Tax=Parvimonas sp. M13 TaxID=3110694 RepID=UPI002B46178C